MKRFLTLVVLLSLVAALTAGCCEANVKVTTGEKLVCVYGETVSSSIKQIEVPASDAANFKVVTKTIVCARHRALEALYAAAQKALADKDAKTAMEKLAELVKLDATYRQAAEQLKQLQAGTTPAPDTTPPPSQTQTGTVDGGTGLPVAPVPSLAKWVPDTLSGYTARPIIADPAAVTREYVGASGSPVSVLVIVAEHFASSDAAKAGTASTIGSQYSANRGQVSVKGRTLEFGTNGTGFAAVGWNEGSTGIVIEAAASGGSPTALKGALQDAAGAIMP
jgi:hypothetical protein